MNLEDTGRSCLILVIAVVAVVAGYSGVLSLFGNNLQWWHYVVAVPLAIPAGLFLVDWWGFNFAYSTVIFVWLVTYLGLPALGIWLCIELIGRGLGRWVLAEGVGYLVIGAVCAAQANKNQSPTWALNSLVGFIGGVVLIIIGIVAFFL
jgi:hypothetical protein